MSLRTGAQYLESLRDGREVWLDGERVDVTSHPLLAPCAHTLAGVYDLQHEAAHRDLLTMPSTDTGDRVSLAYLLPRSTDDLVRRRLMIEFLMRRSGGTMGRLPEYMATILMGLYNARDLLASVDPAYAARVADYFAYCREHDLCLTHGFSDPQRDRNRPANDYEPLHVADRTADGIVIRGVKAVATLAPYANEYLGLTAPRPDLRPAEVIYFAVPLAAPGVRVVCRESFTRVSSDDHPLAASFDEMDAWMRPVWSDIRGASLRDGHPAPFPAELAERLIRMFSFAGDTVLDPFAGSGSTAIAAVRAGRSSISVEIEKEYLAAATRRVARHIAETPARNHTAVIVEATRPASPRAPRGDGVVLSVTGPVPSTF